LQEYLKGVTPNPCIICNERMKFGYLLDYAKAQGIEYIATGITRKIILIIKLADTRSKKVKTTRKTSLMFYFH